MIAGSDKRLCGLLEKERRRVTELEAELSELQHANVVDEMLELQVTDAVESYILLFNARFCALAVNFF